MLSERTTHDTPIPGCRSAAMLYSLGLPTEAVVRGLIEDVGLTRDEATRATSAAHASRRSARLVA